MSNNQIHPIGATMKSVWVVHRKDGKRWTYFDCKPTREKARGCVKLAEQNPKLFRVQKFDIDRADLTGAFMLAFEQYNKGGHTIDESARMAFEIVVYGLPF